MAYSQSQTIYHLRSHLTRYDYVSVLQAARVPVLFLQELPEDLFEGLSAFLVWKTRFFESNPIAARFLLGAGRLPADYDRNPWRPRLQQRRVLEILVLLFEALDQRWLQAHYVVEAAFQHDNGSLDELRS